MDSAVGSTRTETAMKAHLYMMLVMEVGHIPGKMETSIVEISLRTNDKER